MEEKREYEARRFRGVVSAVRALQETMLLYLFFSAFWRLSLDEAGYLGEFSWID